MREVYVAIGGRAIVAESASKIGPSRAPGLSRTMASPRLNLAVRRVSPPLARDMRRRNPWQEVAGSSCPPGGAWITGEVDASCRGRVEGDSCQVAQLYGVCRWYVRRGPRVWNLVHVRLSRHGHDTNVPLAMARTLTLSLDGIGKLERKTDESPVECPPCRMVQIKRPDCLRSIMSPFRGSEECG